jgi:hypothetical protein
LILEKTSLNRGKTQMANIKITEVTPSGSDLFADSESYLTELSETELNNTKGGFWWTVIFLATVVR